MPHTGHDTADPLDRHRDPLSRLVRIFLDSNLSIILIIFSLLLGAAALLVTPREEDPQIVVPLADVYVQFPGHSAAEVEQLVASPLERLLYQIDGVEYVYSMSRENLAIITVRFYVGQDRERSLVKLFKKLNENVDIVPPGVTGWVMKPVEIDDVPIVTLTLTSKAARNSHSGAGQLSCCGGSVRNSSNGWPWSPKSRAPTSSAGNPARLPWNWTRIVMRAYQLSTAEVTRAIRVSNVTVPAGEFTRSDKVVHVEAGVGLSRPDQVGDLVVGVFDGRPVFVKDVATVRDGPDELTSYVRHGWGPAHTFALHPGSAGTEVGAKHEEQGASESELPGHAPPSSAVTIAIAKQKGANAVAVAESVLETAEQLQRRAPA